MNVADLTHHPTHLDRDTELRLLIVDRQGALLEPITVNLDDVTLAIDDNAKREALWLTGTVNDHQPPASIRARRVCGAVELACWQDLLTDKRAEKDLVRALPPGAVVPPRRFGAG